MNSKIIFPLSLLFFAILEVFILKNGQFQIGIIFYLFYVIILFTINKKLLISFFVFHLPILPIIPTDYKMFGILGPFEIIYGAAFFVLLTLNTGIKHKLNKYQKLAISFVYFLFFINVYVIIKDIVLEIDTDKSRGGFFIFKRTFRYFLYHYSLVLLIKNIYQKEIYNYFFIGLKYSVVVLVLSMLFTEELILMGADIANKDTFFKVKSLRERFIGLYGAGGDQNSAGVFFASIFGFLLALYEKMGNLNKYIIFMGFAIFGVLLTGSRTAFLALACVILIFLITNKSGSAKFAFLITIIIFYFVFSKQLDLVIQRFFDPSAQRAIDPNETGRVYKWIYYTNWILDNPETLLFGNQKNIPLTKAPHNYFIYIVYHSGIIPLIAFLSLFTRLVKSIKFKFSKSTLKNVYYILPIPFVLMTVNSFGASIYLWLFLPIGAYFVNDNS